ncbi:hypothetical protein [Flavobacterium sp.]|jgi:nitrate reductase NapE component|uniref:hypothetical protein n=1 Tax=Flavobacterium sp. TaxID=239 RepID=UPI0037BEA3EC
MYKKVANWKLKVGSSKKFFILIAYYLFPIVSSAQCAMCRASLQGDQNVAKAEAVNDGIVYLMIIPYVLVGAIGYYIFRMYKKKDN